MSTQSYKKQDAYASGLPDKMAVFQECLQQFNASPVNAKKCRQLLATLLRLLYHGETFPSSESTTLFFSISKLFQHKDSSLRQMVYLGIKELSSTSQDILMVTSSIMKDIQGGDLVYKPNAIRTLAKVLDATTVSSAERLFKNAIVDKNPTVSSAALISAYHLLPQSKEVVKRFTNEALEAVSSYKSFPPTQWQTHEFYGASTSNLPQTSYMYQYHALGLLYHLRNHDKMGLMKLISQLTEGSALKNSLATIQVIRYINKLLTDDPGLLTPLYPVLGGFLKHKSDMVELEAAKTLVALSPQLSDEQFMGIVACLQKLLSVPRTSTRFAAVRLINKISQNHPEKIGVVSQELESLINDSNRSVSTLAITTLLKTMGSSPAEASSASVDRLITKMTQLMDEITEDFKIVIIDAIENLALKFPHKHKKLVTFLTDLLRDDGSLQLKTAIVDALFDLIRYLDDSSAQQLILMNLCEFIEDCEYTELSVRILHLLGQQGPHTSNPSYYIRHIYNRLVLENSIVRSSAVIALAKFATHCGGSIAKNIEILLTRCLNDVDDEVRDRAAISLGFMKRAPDARKLLGAEGRYDLSSLESKLSSYLAEQHFDHRFPIAEVPLLTEDELRSVEYSQKISKLEQSVEAPEAQADAVEATPEASAASDLVKQQQYEQELHEIPEIQAFGKLAKSSAPVYLTERENEFVVTAVKHVFADASKVVVQYNVTNTLNNCKLDDVSIAVESDNDAYEIEFNVPITELGPNDTGVVYVAMSAPQLGGDVDVLAAFGNTLIYTYRELDDGVPDEGYSDEYQIEDLEVLAGDFILPLYNSNFSSVYDTLPGAETAVVSIRDAPTLETCVTKVKAALNMMPLDGSDYVPSDATSHTIKLLGKDVFGGKVGATVRLAQTGGKIAAKVEARAETEGVALLVVSSV
ncbi:coatomer subunit gamma [Diutina catenulata]